MRRLRSRTWLVVLGVCAIATGIVVALLLSPTPVPVEPEPTGVPEEWFALLAPPPLGIAELAPTGSEPDESLSERDTGSLPVGYVQSGRLAYELDGKRVAEETYRLQGSGSGEVRLVSSGILSVRVLFVTVNVEFTQEIGLDRDLRPRSYLLETQGPLGIGNQRIAVTVDGERAIATVGDERWELAVPAGNAFFMGTLAAYAVLPALYAARAQGGALTLEAIGVARGPAVGSRSGSAVDAAVELARQGTVEVLVGGRALELDRYRVRLGTAGGVLLAWGPEFVAFLGEGERALNVYRADLFPHGTGLFPGETR